VLSLQRGLGSSFFPLVTLDRKTRWLFHLGVISAKYGYWCIEIVTGFDSEFSGKGAHDGLGLHVGSGVLYQKSELASAPTHDSWLGRA